ncbi:hypothetical protein HWC29_gp141 [Aeromonas phage 4_4572]|nr:hypothetical protein HWC29_gp141 [Aeromonas phage 4_4572]QEG09045.1 hypothetical protein [Aeromonas phage 4_4572]
MQRDSETKLIYNGQYYDCLFNGVMYVIRNKLLEHDEVFSETMTTAITQCKALNQITSDLQNADDPRLVLWD